MDSCDYFSVFSLRVLSWGGKKKSVINGCVSRYEIMGKYVILGIAGSQSLYLEGNAFFLFSSFHWILISIASPALWQSSLIPCSNQNKRKKYGVPKF